MSEGNQQSVKHIGMGLAMMKICTPVPYVYKICVFILKIWDFVYVKLSSYFTLAYGIDSYHESLWMSHLVDLNYDLKKDTN